jgi:hypothetical protein
MKLLGLVACLFSSLIAFAAKDDISVADLVKKHLDSIGSEQARAAVKSRVVQGVVRFRVLSGGRSEYMSLAATPEGKEEMGKEVFVSEGSKLVSLLKLPNPSYHGERFVSDGSRNLVAEMKPGTYSDVGDFVHVHDEILKEGLWGGTLSTGWPLAHLEDRHAALKYKGLKKIDGREFHVVQYLPAKHSDLEIELCFDAQTFHHKMTTYSLTINPQISINDQLTARQQPTRYVLEEQFVDFKPTDDLQLPQRWIIRYTANVQKTRGIPGVICAGPVGAGKGGTCTTYVSGAPESLDLKPFAVEFDTIGTSISHNVSLDPKNFEVK